MCFSRVVEQLCPYQQSTVLERSLGSGRGHLVDSGSAVGACPYTGPQTQAGGSKSLLLLCPINTASGAAYKSSVIIGKVKAKLGYLLIREDIPVQCGDVIKAPHSRHNEN